MLVEQEGLEITFDNAWNRKEIIAKAVARKLSIPPVPQLTVTPKPDQDEGHISPAPSSVPPETPSFRLNTPLVSIYIQRDAHVVYLLSFLMI